MIDLVVLAADKDADQGLQSLLARHAALGLAAFTATYLVHPQHDPGCVHAATEVLAPLRGSHRRALVVFDHAGSGRENLSREQLELEVESKLKTAGWGANAAAVVIEPELEAWFWSDSPHVAAALRWDESRLPPIREWLTAQGFLGRGQVKPAKPKEAVEAALRKANRPWSASRFGELGGKVGTTGCVDPAFKKLRDVLRGWFPQRPGALRRPKRSKR